MEKEKEPRTIDEYIAQFPENVREIMQQLRQVIHHAAPDSVEKISWGMPTFYQNGNLIHFAGHKAHIGLYPGPEAVEVFAPKLAEYKTSKGAIQLPLSRPTPYDLVREITLFRVEQSTAGDKKG